MQRLTKTMLASGFAALALAAVPAAPLLADDPAVRSEAAEKADFQADREAILSMAGDHAVVFDMQESTPWMEGYEPIDRKVSSGYESVRVVEDTGEKIVLQHLLVVDTEKGPYVVKHWRQDWEYEPETILDFKGGDTWELEPVPAEEREGAWSQTVYQVDDSPRYAGYGRWETTNGVKSWTSNATARPLARRDAVRDPVYDRYVGVNRHQLTPDGWIHWQDNTKLKPAKDEEGKLVPVVQEYVLNTYERYDGYEVAAAEEYWSKTKDYWEAIRGAWERIALENGGIRIPQNPEVGTTIAGDLLKMADAIKKGEMASDEASAKAVALIEEGTARSGG
ncbi:MAG: hypothetical protein GVX90_06705 [Alphaproteobacteria bacterium]|jgi:hypothetical protein|nr:hypothetical protein [Alphaproteobacteria bacterium]